MNMRNVLFIFLGLLTLLFALLNYSKTRVQLLEWKYDLTHQNDKITSKQAIDSLLNLLPKRTYKKLDPDYLKWSKSDFGKYKRLLQNSTYRIIQQDDFFRKIVGDFRIKDFVCPDSLYKECLYQSEKEYYWLIDKKLLYAVLNLQHSLRAKGLNPDGFRITYGHRHPKKNEEVKGAGSSRHIKGEAIDMVIEDINGDGSYSKEDKAIVIKIANQEVIGNLGGIGRYPNTRVVHIDVRGKRARWDSY